MKTKTTPAHELARGRLADRAGYWVRDRMLASDHVVDAEPYAAAGWTSSVVEEVLDEIRECLTHRAEFDLAVCRVSKRLGQAMRVTARRESTG
jgi:hypothetical protein